MADRGGDIPYIPYIVYDEAVARHERMCKRLWITIVLLIVLLVLSNGLWVYRETQYEDVVTVTQEADTRGGSITLNGTAEGDINYGAGETDDN